MEVALSGSSPCATIAAILLITRARQLGMRVRASIVGDASDIAAMHGPAVVYSPVLASCGIGRDLGTGATVVVRGPPGSPLLVSIDDDGTGGWFLVDRDGRGVHVASEAFVRLSRDPRLSARKLAKDLRRAMESLGMSPDPAVLDVLFGAPASPLSRLMLALRAGRAISGLRGEPVTRYLSGAETDADPRPSMFDRDAFQSELDKGLTFVLDGLSTSVRDRVEEWLDTARALATEDGGRDLPLVYALAEVASHLVQLPAHSILPPLSAHEDAVATAIRTGLTADGDEDANGQLRAMFTFLGGKYVTSADNALSLPSVPPPKDPVERWRWFCEEAVRGRRWADEVWPNLVDPPQ
jgi:hypothetical protein